MKKLLLVASFLLAGNSNACLISPAGVTGTGVFHHDPDLIIDGVVPTEVTWWQNAKNVWWNTVAPIFTVDLGDLYRVYDVLVSVDNNDSYSIQWSVDSSTWTDLFHIPSTVGEITFGMDTMSTNSGDAEYVSALDFSPVQARYLRIFATAGDNQYAVGELKVFGAPTAATVWLFGSSLIGLIGMRRRKVY